MLDPNDPERVQDMVTELVRVGDEPLDEIKTKAEASRKKKRDIRYGTGLSKCRADNFVLMARPRKPAKFIGVWTGPWRVVLEVWYVYIPEDLLSVARVKTHVSRMRPYSDSSLAVMKLKAVASRIRLLGELKMDGIFDIGPSGNGS